MSLSRTDILAASDVAIETVLVPEWGGTVCVRTFDGSARDKIEAHVMRNGTANFDGLRALVVALAACDESGASIFTIADIDAISRKSSVALDRVFSAASKLNKLNDNAEETRADFFDGQKKGSGTA